MRLPNKKQIEMLLKALIYILTALLGWLTGSSFVYLF